MMKMFPRKLPVIFISMLAGCAPLQQAPLVYSSKVAVGVDVSATSTETPGVGVSVGYKQVDAAYVPVAVARKCELATEENCLKETYNILRLNGDYNNSNSDQPTPSQIAAASSAADKAAKDLTKAREFHSAIEARYNTAMASEAEAKRDYEQIITNAPESADEVQLKNKEVIAATDNVKKTAAELKAAVAAVELATNENIAASQKYQRTMDSGKGHSLNGKKDAFSVFGSFSSKSDSSVENATRAGVTLSLGKIFSTGVASQHLTEGMKAYFSAAAPGSCFENGGRLILSIPEADRKNAADKIIAACSAISQ